MNRNSKIVRTKTTHNLNDSIERQYYSTRFMTFDKYIKESNWKINGQKFELYPYKIYDIRCLFEIPSYWILLKFFRNKEHKIATETHKATSTIVLIVEILSITKSIIEFINN